MNKFDTLGKHKQPVSKLKDKTIMPKKTGAVPKGYAHTYSAVKNKWSGVGSIRHGSGRGGRRGG